MKIQDLKLNSAALQAPAAGRFRIELLEERIAPRRALRRPWTAPTGGASASNPATVPDANPAGDGF
jgi:hypothetical protein